MSSPLPTVKFRARSLNLNTSTAGLTGTLQVEAPAARAAVVPAEQGGFGSAVPFVGEPEAARNHEVAHPPAAAPVRFRRAPRKTDAAEVPAAPAAPAAATPAPAIAPAVPATEPVAEAPAAPVAPAAPAAPSAKRDEIDEELAEEIELLSTATKPRAKREVYSAIVGRPEAKSAPAAAPANGAAAPTAAAVPAAPTPAGTAPAAAAPATAEAPLRFNPEQWAAAARAARAPREAEARGGFFKRTIGGLCAFGVLCVGGYYGYTAFFGPPPAEVTQMLVAAKEKATAALPETVKQVVASAPADAPAASAPAAGHGAAGKSVKAAPAAAAGGSAIASAKPAAGPVGGSAAAPSTTAATATPATAAAAGAPAATPAGESKELRPAMSLKETIDHVAKLPFKSIEQTKKVVAMNNARVALTDAVINEETRDSDDDADTGPAEVPDGMSVAEFKKTAKGAAAMKKKSGVRNAAQEGVVLAKTSSLSAREIDAFDSFVMSAKISAVVPPRAIINETLYTTGATVHHGFNIQLHAIDTENRLIVFQHSSGRLGTRRY